MCDEARGNGYWQFLSCLFLFHTHTHMHIRTHTKTKTFGLPQLAPPAVCELVLVANGQARPPPPLPCDANSKRFWPHSTSAHPTPENHLLLMCN